jgi:tRNA pseudouridine55 synthase
MNLLKKPSTIMTMAAESSNNADRLGGWLCLDKSAGMSSNSAMMKVKKIFGGKMGYVGTLDPFATGVLPIAVGEARKFIPYVAAAEKTYVFTMKFGTETDSLDVDGKIVRTCENIPPIYEIRDVLADFLGEQWQTPPIFSAIKVNGKRACDRVRAGEHVNLSDRKITVFSLELADDSPSDRSVSLKVVCSKGTYIRSLARDMAEKLGTVAYVESLRRLKSGFFSINDAIPLEKLLKMKDTSELSHLFLSFEGPLDDIPALFLKTDDVTRLQRGLRISFCDSSVRSSNVRVFDESSRVFKGIGFVSGDGELKAVRMCAY